jgi:hypothetical protein
MELERHASVVGAFHVLMALTGLTDWNDALEYGPVGRNRSRSNYKLVSVHWAYKELRVSRSYLPGGEPRRTFLTGGIP